ncbi:MAG TPA: PQQ-binding-like beta-propeller repeat protein [Myxococcota bacterium]|nr:PQQ-binding-like beta-propeller repeat protein [Myxococcota bacterium]
MAKKLFAALAVTAFFAVACGGGPQVVSTYPAAGAEGIPLDASIEVVFDRAIKLSSDIPPLTLSLDGRPVEGVVSVGKGGGQLIFTPRFLLIAGRSYSARLSGNLRDYNGRSFNGSQRWGFTAVEGCQMSNSSRARMQSGPDGKGGFIIPGGRRVSPMGAQLDLGSLPTNQILSPDGTRLVVTNNGYGHGPNKEQSLMVIDPALPKLLQTVSRPRPQALFYGLAYSSDGSRFYAAGGEANVVEVFDVAADGTLTKNTQFDVDGFPAGLLLDEARGLVYVTAQSSGQVEAHDATTGDRLWKSQVGILPYDLELGPGGERLYVSLWGRSQLFDPGQVAVLDPGNGKVLSKIDVGKNPEDLLLAPDGRLFVVCSDGDSVDVIDTDSDQASASWSLLQRPGDPVGLSPVALALDLPRSRLYVACALKNSVMVLSLSDGSILGDIPTAWYPTAVTLSRDGRSLYVVNGKGIGSGPHLEPVNNETLMYGTLSVLPVPTDDQLESLSDTVRGNNDWSLGFYPDRCLGKAFPVPRALGEPSPIKHVIFILRENKTYDEDLGDLEGSDGDPSLVMFGEEITPNLHALAREFCNLNNFYTEIEVSVQGHYWVVASTLNDYAEKAWQANYRDDGRLPALGLKQPDYPAGLFIWHRLDEAGIDFRNYGEPYGLAAEYDRFSEHINMDYMLDLGTNLYSTPDAQRAEWFLQEVEDDIFPPFVYLALLNDHTYGRKPDLPTPEWMIAENDYATGLVVDRISHSKYWPETLIIITEDDPQSGLDHVDMHRSIAIMISPYTKRGYNCPVHHGFSSLIRTYGLILGMPPLNLLDETAAPVYDCFTPEPDLTPYDAREMRLSYQESSLDDPGALESLKMDFSAPDRAKGLGKVLWMATHPGEPVPEALLHQDDDDDDYEAKRLLPVPVWRKTPWEENK